VQDSLAWALRRAARTSAQDSACPGDALAGAYAMAWQDSFLVRRWRFEAWTPAQRSAW
jgi:hypothetical protein